ncbi:MAG: hypothetical protein ACKVP7_12730 [Hyphomicrobiaceae bacterium]
MMFMALPLGAQAGEAALERRAAGPLPSLEEDNRSERQEVARALPGFERPAVVAPAVPARTVPAAEPPQRSKGDGQVVPRPRVVPMAAVPSARWRRTVDEIRRAAFSPEKGS